jgi:hypothetical protein
VKIVFLGVRDTGGTCYTLAHAINRITPENQAINIVGEDTFIHYPMMVNMGDYSRSNIRQMVYNSDVIVFLGAMNPFYRALDLSRKKLKDKKKLLLCMGSEWRLGRDQLIKQADHHLRDYKIALGGADMFLPLTFRHPETHVQTSFEAVDDSEVAYLPVVRPIDEILERYTFNKQDEVAVESFAVPRKRVVFAHAPTSEAAKGSQMFYKACTRAQQVCNNLIFTMIRQQSWTTTLNILSKSDVLYDQAPPFPTAYGALSVEAGIFHMPSFSQVAPECRAFIKKHTGLDTPYIVFADDEDLFRKSVAVASDERLRREFGEANYRYVRQLHDEKPVVQRFMDIVEKM